MAEEQQNRGRPAAPDPRGGFTVRAVLGGLGLAALWVFCYTSRYTIQREIVLHQLVLIAGLGAVLTLFAAKALHDLLLPAGRGLRRAEWVVLFAILLPAIPASVMMRGALEAAATIALPDYNGAAAPTAQWAPAAWKLEPGGGEEGALAGFLHGNGGRVPWGAWLKPLLYWGGLLLVFQGLLIGLFLLLRRRWVEEEKLHFPFARLPLAIVGEAGEGAPGVRFRAWRPWLGFAAGLAFCLPRLFAAAGGEAAALPPDYVNFNLSITTLSTSLVEDWATHLTYDPLIIALLLFFSAETLFTAAVTYLGCRVVLPFLVGLAGYPVRHLGENLLNHAVLEGGVIGLVFWSLFFQGRWLLRRLGALRRRRPPEAAPKAAPDPDEPLPRRWLWPACLALGVAFLVLAFPVRPYPWALALFTLALILAFTVGFARLRAEGGFDTMDPYGPARLHAWAEAYPLAALGQAGTKGLWGSAAGWMAQGHVWSLAGYFRGLGAHMFTLDLFCLGARAGVRSRQVLAALLIGILAGMALGAPLYLGNVYEAGCPDSAALRHANYLNWTYNAHRFGTEIVPPETAAASIPSRHGYLFWLPIGFVLTGLIMYLRRERPRFPFTAGGFVFAGCMWTERTLVGTNEIWFPILLAWGIKTLACRWWGVRAFRERGLAFALFPAMGLALGVALNVGVFALVLGQGVMISGAAPTLAGAGPEAELAPAALLAAARERVLPRVLAHAEALAGAGSRLTGQPGCERAAEYVRGQLAEILGAENVSLLRYPAAAPAGDGGEIRAGGRAFAAWPLRPNNARASATIPEGLEAPLVDLGDGSFAAPLARPLAGAIALLDFNSGEAWLAAADQGARAAVFIAPEWTTYRQADSKYLAAVPLDFPRAWVSAADGAELRRLAAAGASASLRLAQRLAEVEAPAIEGRLAGTGPDRATVVFTAALDARSVVPGLSPGGDEVWGAAALLELARRWRERPPRNDVRFLFFAGHWQGQAAAREYVADRLGEIGGPVRLVLGLDLSCDSPALSLQQGGYSDAVGPSYFRRSRYTQVKEWLFAGAPGEPAWYAQLNRPEGPFFEFYADKRPNTLEDTQPLAPHAFQTPFTLAPHFSTPDEPWLAAGAFVLTLQTARLQRWTHHTPLDTFAASRARAANLGPQLAMLDFLADKFAGLPAARLPRSGAVYRGANSQAGGYLELAGELLHWDNALSWYRRGLPPGREGEPLAETWLYVLALHDAPVRGPYRSYLPRPLGPDRFQHRNLQSFMCDYLLKVHETAGPDGPRAGYRLRLPYAENLHVKYTAQAWSFDAAGRLLYAADYGLRGAQEFRFADRYAEHWRLRFNVAQFPCAALVFFDLTDQTRYDFSRQVEEQWVRRGGLQDLGCQPWLRLDEVRDARAHTEADYFSFAQYRQVGLALVPPGAAVEVLATSGPLGKRAVANGAVGGGGEAPGYRLEWGECRPLHGTGRELARMLHALDERRLADFARQGVASADSRAAHREAGEFLAAADAALAAGDVRAARCAAVLAFERESAAYAATLGLLYDVVSTTIFYFVLLIPFAFVVERLAFPQPGAGRVAAAAGAVFAAAVGLLWIFHPGFRLAGNIFVTIVTFLIVLFTLPALFLILGRGARLLREWGRARGPARPEGERAGILVSALSLAVSNMRRRPLRTGLTLATITMLVLSLVLLTTSASFSYVVSEPRGGGAAPWRGIQVFNTFDHSRGLLNENVALLQARYAARARILLRRHLRYNFLDTPNLRLFARRPGAPGEPLPAGRRRLPGGGRVPAPEFGVPVEAVSFVAPEEGELLGAAAAIPPGRGGWFEPADRLAILVGESLAAKLELAPGDQVEFAGLNLAVRGIFSEQAVDARRDLDDRPVTPLESAEEPGARDDPGHVKAALTVFLPAALEREYACFPAVTWSVILLPRAAADREALAAEIAREFANVDVYAGGEEGVAIVSAYRRGRVQGSSFLVLPLIVTFFLILSVMTGNVYERRREIHIFSAVGLSPGHVAGMFLIEALVYAAIASVVGYFLGIILLYCFRVWGWLPADFYPSYLGVYVLYAVGLAALATLSSALYPMWLASRLANPSRERAWQAHTAPEGDRWAIPLPFIATTAAEAQGLLLFLGEFLDARAGEHTGLFSLARPVRLEALPEARSWALAGEAWLAPFERDLRQELVLAAGPEAGGRRWAYRLELRRLSGPPYLWERGNRAFVDALRRRMLAWGALGEAEARRYAARAAERLAADG